MNSQNHSLMLPAEPGAAVCPPAGEQLALSGGPPGKPGERIRRKLSLPGALIGAVERRVAELGRRTVSRYIVELACYDLRNRHLHGLTGPIAHEPAEVQEAVDRMIDANFEEGVKSNTERMEHLVKGKLAEARATRLPTGALAAVDRDVFFPALHTDILEIRCRELRFDCLSQYATSVARYDLLLGGPHKLFYKDDCTPEMCAALDVETRREFFAREHNPKKCLIDYTVERMAGREMSYPERHARMRLASERIVQEALAAQKQARKAG